MLHSLIPARVRSSGGGGQSVQMRALCHPHWSMALAVMALAVSAVALGSCAAAAVCPLQISTGRLRLRGGGARAHRARIQKTPDEHAANEGGNATAHRLWAADRTATCPGKISAPKLNPSAGKKLRRWRKLCEHQRQQSQCKDCGGSSICEHQRRRSTCKECSGSGICPHQRQRSTCTHCGGSSVCAHQRQRSTCKDCGGSGICEHQRRRQQCKDCGGSNICEHRRQRGKCKDCGDRSISEHSREWIDRKDSGVTTDNTGRTKTAAVVVSVCTSSKGVSVQNNSEWRFTVKTATAACEHM